MKLFKSFLLLPSILAASSLLLATSGVFAADTNHSGPGAPQPYQPAEVVRTTSSAVILNRDALTPRMIADAIVPDFTLRATLYHTGNPGVGLKDSIGCRPIAMRTAATDPRLIPRRTILFIAETVGQRMPDGSVHDGFWYASDVGGAIKGNKIDLYTGIGSASMRPVIKLSLKSMRVMRVGTFRGCPKPDRASHNDMLTQIAQRAGMFQPQPTIDDLLANASQRQFRQGWQIQP